MNASDSFTWNTWPLPRPRSHSVLPLLFLLLVGILWLVLSLATEVSFRHEDSFVD